MTDDWIFGRVLGSQDIANEAKSAVVAMIHERSDRVTTESMQGACFVVDSLTQDEATRAIDFFYTQPDLLVDYPALIVASGAETPAIVVIRGVHEIKQFMAAANEKGVFFGLPADEMVYRDGWALFCALDAIENGRPIPEFHGLPAFNAREAQRHLLALRVRNPADRSAARLESVYQGICLVQDKIGTADRILNNLVEDLRAALCGEIQPSDKLSVIVPTTIGQRDLRAGQIAWPELGTTEVLVGFGLDPLHAAYLFSEVSRDPAQFVRREALLRANDVQETVLAPRIVRDRDLAWTKVDCDNRRDDAAYDRVRAASFGSKVAAFPTRALGSTR